MKAIIEHWIFNISDNNVTYEFCTILQTINRAKSEDALRSNINYLALEYFKCGFGSNHLWVHQIHNGTLVKERLIFVEF